MNISLDTVGTDRTNTADIRETFNPSIVNATRPINYGDLATGWSIHLPVPMIKAGQRPICIIRDTGMILPWKMDGIGIFEPIQFPEGYLRADSPAKIVSDGYFLPHYLMWFSHLFNSGSIRTSIRINTNTSIGGVLALRRLDNISRLIRFKETDKDDPLSHKYVGYVSVNSLNASSRYTGGAINVDLSLYRNATMISLPACAARTPYPHHHMLRVAKNYLAALKAEKQVDALLARQVCDQLFSTFPESPIGVYLLTDVTGATGSFSITLFHEVIETVIWSFPTLPSRFGDGNDISISDQSSYYYLVPAAHFYPGTDSEEDMDGDLQYSMRESCAI